MAKKDKSNFHALGWALFLLVCFRWFFGWFVPEDMARIEVRNTGTVLIENLSLEAYGEYVSSSVLYPSQSVFWHFPIEGDHDIDIEYEFATT